MNFNSWQFVLFLLLVLALALPLRRHSTASKGLLLLASYVFYGSWNWQYLGLILFSTGFDYWIAPRFAGSAHPRRLIALSVLVNLGVLGFFKYADFLIHSVNAGLATAGAAVQFGTLDLLLPVGISFYTFQSMSYTIDVYRGQLAPRRSLLDYALFVAFFPQLVAGPIVRAVEFFRELDHPRRLHLARLNQALILIAFGYVKKVVFADSLAQAFDPLWLDPGQADPWAMLLAVYAFALQIYFDFSGYTDIAIGVALLFGFRFPPNFDYPYVASSVQEFWRRWHMTLSRWLRDYLYIALGGNRRGPGRTQINLLLTMLLGGLWHGASWNFVIWGGLHGLYLVGERLLLPRLPGYASQRLPLRLLRWLLPFLAGTPTLLRWLRWLLTFHLVCFAWIFFRAPDLATSLSVVERIASARVGGFDWVTLQASVLALLALLGAHGLAHRLRLKRRLALAPLPLHAAALAAAMLMLIWFAPEQSTPFLYFQF